MPSSPDGWAVVVAAGAGTRFGGPVPKQFANLAGRPLVLWTLEPFLAHPELLGLTLVVPSNYVEEPPDWLESLREREGVRVVIGGTRRSDSVRAGLAEVDAAAEVVLIHDGARPLVTREIVSRVLSAVKPPQGAIIGRRVRDTLKAVAGDGRIVRTVDRTGFWRAETPQAFPRGPLEEVFDRAAREDVVASDCAGLWEKYGMDVVVVEIQAPNLKVTTREDLALAEAWMRCRGT